MYKKGNISWSKINKHLMKANSGSFKKGGISPFTGKHHSEESKQKIREAKKGSIPWIKGKKGIIKPNNGNFKKGHTPIAGFKKGHSPTSSCYKKGNLPYMTGKHFSEESRAKMSKATEGRIFIQQNTTIEIALQNALTNLDIPFTTHKKIIGRPDIFIEPNICVFADGDYWHSIPKALKRDPLVNHKLQEMGYKVLRFWGKDIENNLDGCVGRILDEKKLSSIYCQAS